MLLEMRHTTLGLRQETNNRLPPRPLISSVMFIWVNSLNRVAGGCPNAWFKPDTRQWSLMLLNATF